MAAAAALLAAQAELIMYDTVGRGSGASTLVKLDPDTGALIQTIGSVGYTVNGLEWANGKLYASTSYNDANFLSAAQPQPNDRGEINALVPSLALRRAALKGATSSPNGGRDASRISGRTIRRQRSRRIC